MVIIELVKRLSGLSDARDENIREYVLRRNMEWITSSLFDKYLFIKSIYIFLG